MRYSIATICINSAMMASIGAALALFYFQGAWKNVDMNQPTPSPYCTWEHSYFSCSPSTDPPFTCLPPSESSSYHVKHLDSVSLALGLSNWKLFGLLFGIMSFLFATNILLHDLYVLSDKGAEIWLLSSPQAADIQRFVSHQKSNPHSLFANILLTLVWIITCIPSFFLAPILLIFRVPRHFYASLIHPLRSSYINSLVCLGVLFFTSVAMLAFSVWTYFLGAALFQKRHGPCMCGCFYKITSNSTIYMLYLSAAAMIKSAHYFHTLYKKGANFVFSVQHHVPHPTAKLLRPDEPSFNIFPFPEHPNSQSTTNERYGSPTTSRARSTRSPSTTDDVDLTTSPRSRDKTAYDLRKTLRKKKIFDL